VALIDSDRRCALVYCNARVSGESPLAGQRVTDMAPSDGDVTLISLIQRPCRIVLSTVVARRRAIVAAGLFDETLRRGQDFELWLRLAWRGEVIAYHRDVLADRRVRDEGLSGEAVRTVERALNVLDRFARGRTLDLPCEPRCESA
jgi:hypothetical protein